tara:strand:- start:125 stop:1123 length:999 start_codon:yes stop_codon:yes gene_type:complete
MKFYYPTSTDCPIVDYIASKDWNFLDNEQSVDFAYAMNKFNLKHINNSNNQVTPAQRQKCIDNFSDLKDINKICSKEEHINSVQDQNLTVSYADRGKSKTIVAISGGSWLLSLTKNSIEHQYSWMLDMFTDYNVISIVEDVRRSYTNPVLYDSCLYNGINDELNSPEKLADYIKQLIPNTEYNVVADCKNGHSSCMLAYYLNATRVLIQSGTTTCDSDIIFNNNRYITKDGRYNMLNYFDIPFELSLRTLAFCKNVPAHLQSINSIANSMPNTEFTYFYHIHDDEFRLYKDIIDTSLSNIKCRGIDRTPYTYGDHYITLELRQNGVFDSYFR